MFKFLLICASLAIVNGQAPVLPSYYNRPDYPASLYNAAYSQSSPSLNAALAYQQQQNLQRQQALLAYQQQANAAALPQSYPLSSNRPPFTSSPSVNYSPNNLPGVSYQPQSLPQNVPSGLQTQSQPGITYQDQPNYQVPPQASYNQQGLQTLSYQPSEQPAAPVSNYDPQPYNSQPTYNPDEIGMHFDLKLFDLCDVYFLFLSYSKSRFTKTT